MTGSSYLCCLLSAALIFLVMFSAYATKDVDPLQALAKYDVTWDSPSRDAWGTMPTGNGDIGLNVWAEESGDLLFYIGKTDLWDDNSRLLKLGRVRFKALQAMLVQTDGRMIMLLPAWPKDWEADFKLHAPYRTLVSGRVKQGKISELSVQPANRKKDVLVLPAK